MAEKTAIPPNAVDKPPFLHKISSCDEKQGAEK
jgi:hypothetical protein